MSTETTQLQSSPTFTATFLALEAALARIEELGIESVFCGGDLVGYGPHPNEVCALIAEARHTDDLCQLRLSPLPAILRTAAARMSPRMTASLGSAL